MGKMVDKLMATIEGGECYDIAYDDVRDMQVEALNERLKENIDRIKLVGFRAREAGITEINKLEDIVPLLLPHTAYKSYPETVLTQKNWQRLTKWLGTVSSMQLDDINLEGLDNIDEWIERLAEAERYVSCTSGTTGKAAMLPSSKADMEWFCKDNVGAVSWGSGVPPQQDRLVFGLAPISQVPRNVVIGEALRDAFGVPGKERFNYPVPPITIGSIAKMISMRKAIAEGTAQPGEIADFEKTSAERQKAVDAAVGICADALIEARSEKLFISGMWAALYGIAEEVRNRGYSAKDFNPENTCYVAGGLKGAKLPDNYREFVYETFNLRPDHNYQMYSMQEIQTAMPRCQKGGRYHIPPWLICLPLDKEGEQLMPFSADGEVEGRAAFFDLSLDGRWGGLISGDRIQVDFSPCECGAKSPSIRDNVVRYSDLEGDDKISCSGTVDAYVRGVS